ncbi:uncharacterized protein [Panulirus ornatus]|uniref:uncharacterized protein isoform X14 n=1 Tax=Panulirus ornatus TaxID=150431 RepID=UPI003A87A88F
MVIKCLEVNGHSLDSITREFLLDGVDQNVQESWRANYMEVDVFTTRGSPIAGMISGVLTSDNISRQTLVGNYDIGLLVRGNMDVSSINGIRIVELDRSVVKKYGNYRLAGGLVYKDDVVVTGSVQTDTINDELWSNLVDYNSPDKITNTYHFHEVVVAGFLDSNRITKLALSQEVVQ